MIDNASNEISKNKKPKKTGPVHFIFSILKSYKWYYFLILQATFVNALYPILYNYSIKILINLFVQNDNITLAKALLPISMFIGANLVVEVCWRFNNLGSWKVMPNLGQNIMDKVFGYVSQHSYRFYQDNLSGSIISKIKGVSDGFYKIHKGLEYGVSKPILTVIFTGIALFSASWQLFLITIAFMCIQIPISIYCYFRLNRIEEDGQKSWHYIIGLVADNITNIFTLFSFATKKRERQKIWKYYEEVHKKKLLAWHRYDFYMSCTLMAIYWGFIICLFMCMIHLKNIGAISTGDIAFVMSMAYLFSYNIWESLNAVKEFMQHFAQFKVAFSILEEPHENIDKNDAIDLKTSDYSISFQNVSFSYDNGEKVFNNLDFHIKSGEKVALIGHSGAGKSTLISLILKNFKSTSGDILIGNHSIYDLSSDSLRSQISLIPQDTILFHRTIAENIGYAKEDVTFAEIENASKMANIHDFIIKLPNSYNTLVGERGIKLSGGQRQRIAIARAILKNAPILILDEATSSLDSQTEAEIQKSINAILEKNKATVIAIAHRLSTIRHMDRIIVMDDGKIIEDGSFSDLIEISNGKFKELWSHQVNGIVLL